LGWYRGFFWEPDPVGQHDELYRARVKDGLKDLAAYFELTIVLQVLVIRELLPVDEARDVAGAFIQEVEGF